MKNFKVAFAAMVTLIGTLNGCSSRDAHSEKDFAGKWQSSRVTAPIYLYENGEWEIIPDDEESKQYGVWQYKESRIMWTVRVDGRIIHDTNAVLSVTANEFKLRESDGSVSTFSRLD